MYRGTTPTIQIKVKGCDDLRLYKSIYVTFKQMPSILIEKTKEEIEVEADSVRVTLSQEDTLKFNPGTVMAQFRAVDDNGMAIASSIVTFPAERILKEGVIE